MTDSADTPRQTARDTLALLLRLRRRYGTLTDALVVVASQARPDLDNYSALARYLELSRPTVRLALRKRGAGGKKSPHDENDRLR